MQASGYEYSHNRWYSTPGVYFEDVSPRKQREFRSGVPAFLGFAPELAAIRVVEADDFHPPGTLTGWAQFDELFGGAPPWGFLRDAVQGFFRNGGSQCVVIPLPFDTAGPAAFSRSRILRALELLDPFEDVDLICFPDAVLAAAQMLEVQQLVLEACNNRTGRFAILDSYPVADAGTRGRAGQSGALQQLQQHWRELPAGDGALYFPWLRDPRSSHAWIPPCGHVAGIYSRTDSRVGVHKAPANEIVEGAVDLQVRLDDPDQGALNESGINCLRALAGRGIRVWGARTLNGLPDARYVNVRRLFLTLVRRISWSFQDLVFEPYDPSLWEAIRIRLNSFCFALFESGALQGSSSAEAFYVKCDAETNPPEEMEAGRVIAHIGLAAVSPSEFIVVKVAHSAVGPMLLAPAGFGKGDK